MPRSASACVWQAVLWVVTHEVWPSSWQIKLCGQRASGRARPQTKRAGRQPATIVAPVPANGETTQAIRSSTGRASLSSYPSFERLVWAGQSKPWKPSAPLSGRIMWSWCSCQSAWSHSSIKLNFIVIVVKGEEQTNIERGELRGQALGPYHFSEGFCGPSEFICEFRIKRNSCYCGPCMKLHWVV